MPVAAQVGRVFGYDDEVADSDVDHVGATGAEVGLARRIGLHNGHDLYPQRAHASTAAVRRKAPTTIAMSAGLRSCGRKGLKPIVRC